VNTKADIYVFCTASEHDTRLFAKFPNRDGSPADACCVIWDVEEFRRRIESRTKKRFSGWSFHHLPISYFDPYENGKNYISPGVSKQFDYAYQREYRFIWAPPHAATFSNVINVEIGPLTDIMTVFDSARNVLAGAMRRSAA
jgi:hypothetical protein